MPVKFKTLFIVGIIITLLGCCGPILGALLTGGLFWLFRYTHQTWLKWITGVLVVCAAGLPALAVAGLLYGCIYVVWRFLDPLSPNVQPQTQTPSNPAHDIIDAEWVDVN